MPKGKTSNFLANFFSKSSNFLIVLNFSAAKHSFKGSKLYRPDNNLKTKRFWGVRQNYLGFVQNTWSKQGRRYVWIIKCTEKLHDCTNLASSDVVVMSW